MNNKYDNLSFTNKRINEDIFGRTNFSAWVMDGATGYYKNSINGYNSDAEWYVHQWNEFLIKNASNEKYDIKSVLSIGINKIEESYFRNLKYQLNDIHDFPSATIALIKFDKKVIKYFVLGDCVIVVKQNNSIKIITDNRISLFEDKVVKNIIRIQKKSSIGIEKAREAVMDMLKDNRKMKNVEAGYWVIEFNKKAIEYAVEGEIELLEDSEILLMTDGFYRIVDTFHYFKNISELFKEIETNGLRHIWDIITSYENDDYDCIKYPRTKPYDDCTAIFINYF
jgi:serine/threonine protein phosphatase PrpC